MAWCPLSTRPLSKTIMTNYEYAPSKELLLTGHCDDYGIPYLIHVGTRHTKMATVAMVIAVRYGLITMGQSATVFLVSTVQ